MGLNQETATPGVGWSGRPRIGWLIGLIVSGALVGPSSAWSINIAQDPLITGGGVPPNLLLMIDDSGSMHVETGPISDYIIDPPQDAGERRAFPRRAGPFGNYELHNPTPTFNDANKWNLRVRSAANNPLFYDPSVDYEPWVDYTGVPYDDVDPTNAAVDPTQTSDGDLVDPAATGHGGTRDLTTQTTETTNWLQQDDTVDTNADRTFWPMTYYIYDGGDIDDVNSYTKVQIRGSDVYIDNSPATESDLQDLTGRTIAEEKQNFANWHTYFRDRKNTARAGIGRGFQAVPDNFRVGYGPINVGVVDGVREFTTSGKKTFYQSLYGQGFDGGTPLRSALQKAGDYYERSDDEGPWSSTPGESGGDPDGQLSCRKSYTMLMTDGEWDSEDISVGNVDGSAGNTITGPNGESFQYTPEPPYKDNQDNMLADVAMDYWNRDLRGDLENRVPVANANKAFWQHMVTFTVGFGVAGALNFPDDLPALEDGSLDWPDNKVDDLWHAAINGRGEFLNATQPQQFQEGIAQIINTIADRAEGSSSGVAATSTTAGTDNLFFQALFDSEDWSGDVKAYGRDADGNIESVPTWEAAKGINPPRSQVFTIDTSDNSGLRYKESEFSALTSDQQSALSDSALGTGKELAKYLLLGKADQEQSEGGNLRNRPDTVLGDIINSKPEVTRNNNRGYSVLDGAAGSEYANYRANTKPNGSSMLYVGANDGMLHAIDATATGGTETFAFAPDVVFDDLTELAKPDYVHQLFVDGQIRVDDAYIDHDGDGNASWRRILVATTGGGPQGVFALDVTDPDSFSSEDVLWEITGDEVAALGNVLTEPQIEKLNDGTWAAVFGNGYNSETGTAQLIIVPLEKPDNRTTINTTEGKGLGGVTLADLNGDGKPDRAYGGDLEGNLWRFDLSSKKSNDWTKNPNIERLFTATDPDGNAQPITAAPAVDEHSDNEVDVNVLFGTGRFFAVGDNQVSDDPQVESFYSVHDKGENTDLTRSDLFQNQSITNEGFGPDGTPFRELDENESIGPAAAGWVLDLKVDGEKAEGERVVSKPEIIDDRVIFRTLIPDTDPCAFGGSSWLMELGIETGSVPDGLRAFTNVNSDASGVGQTEATLGITVVFNPETNQAELIGSDTTGEPPDDPSKTPTKAGLFGRQSWQELR